MSTYFAIGSYTHTANEVQLSVHKQATFSRRGFRQSTKVVFGVRGVLIQQDGNTTSLTAQMAALENAYAIDNVNCGLYLDAGLTQPTQHTLNISQTIGGTRITSFEWDNGDGTEYVVKRGYTATIEADIPGTNGVLEFHETISVRGNGGPRNIVLENLQAPPQQQQVCQFTKVTATQRGKALGLQGYVSIPGPLWPAALRNDMIEQELEGPIVTPTGAWQYPSSWSYSFESTSPLSGLPTIV